MIAGVEAARPPAWSEPGRTTAEIHTGGWRTRRPRYIEATAPCAAACPAGEPVARWIERAKAGDYAAAWALVREANPFPAVMGRVCAHPCERACNRGTLDSAVAVNALERFVGDWGVRHGAVPRPERRRERVAIVGGGPAGLACAYHLARAGYGVTVFEADRELGGLLRHGIPAYRLPRAVLDREIEMILALGVAVETGCRVNGAAASTLDGWDAVFLATGAGVPMALDVPGAGASNVVDGLTLLRAVNGGARPDLGARVVVVGGGSSAMDVARTARRLGATAVTVLALEARDVMPAIADEVAQALAEGIEIRNGVGVQGFVTDPRNATAALIAPARLGRRADGAIVPVFAGDAAPLAADTFVLAIGQRADVAALPWTLDTADGVVAVNGADATSRPRVFAGGDVAARERTVAHAIGSGTRAARAIMLALGAPETGSRDRSPWVTPRPDVVVGPGAVRLHAFAPVRRAVRWERLPGSRVASFIEVVDGLDPLAARAEAERCFTCGRCTACDTCRVVCPDSAITRAAGGYHVSSAHCKGCGLCARECPRGALEMVAEA